MEKKVYPKPVTRVIELELCGMLATSNGGRAVRGMSSNDNNGMSWKNEGFGDGDYDR